MDNPDTCATEYNSIMQIIMKSLIGWDFNLGKQTNLGIFGMLWSGTEEL
jgi:hypothetical protein